MSEREANLTVIGLIAGTSMDGALYSCA